jgi:hypothetical protein
MLVKLLGAVIAVGTLELMALALPAQADPAENCATYSESLTLQWTIESLQSQDNNFFDGGQERFEQEVERILQEQAGSAPPLLTIDASVLVKPEAGEHLNDQSRPGIVVD